MKTRNQYIDLIKFFACLFITNSHCMYSNSLFKLGGGWGNSIFFIVSGYLLSGITMDFFPWIKKRIVRIVPMTLAITILATFVYGIDKYSIEDHALRFWFIIAILIYYIPFYLADRIPNGYLLILGIHILGYIIIYAINDKSTFFVELGGFAIFKVYFYLSIMIMGGFISKIYSKKRIYPSIHFLIFIGGLGFAIWFVEYFCIKVLGTMMKYQFLIHVGISIFAISVLLWALAMFERYPSAKLPRFISVVSSSTLEVYLVQVLLLPYLNKIPYPISIICFWIVAIIGGVALHLITNRLSNIRIRVKK